MTVTQQIISYLKNLGFEWNASGTLANPNATTSSDNYTGVIGSIKYKVSRSSFDKTDPNYTLEQFIVDLNNSSFIARYNVNTGDRIQDNKDVELKDCKLNNVTQQEVADAIQVLYKLKDKLSDTELAILKVL